MIPVIHSRGQSSHPVQLLYCTVQSHYCTVPVYTVQYSTVLYVLTKIAHTVQYSTVNSRLYQYSTDGAGKKEKGAPHPANCTVRTVCNNRVSSRAWPRAHPVGLGWCPWDPLGGAGGIEQTRGLGREPGRTHPVQHLPSRLQRGWLCTVHIYFVRMVGEVCLSDFLLMLGHFFFIFFFSVCQHPAPVLQK